MKIIFLLINTFSKRDYNRFGFEIFKKNGFEIQAWDCLNVTDTLYNN